MGERKIRNQEIPKRKRPRFPRILGFCLRKINGEWLLSGFENAENVLLDELSYLFGLFEVTSLQSLTNPFDELMRRLHA